MGRCTQNQKFVTEKIFDCFTSGCIPIYIGSTHRTALVPEDCYIDGDRFNSPAEMLQFLQSIDADSHACYQTAIQRFLAGSDSVRFTNAYFCESLVNGVMVDLMAV